MSEWKWIDRREREPEDGVWVLVPPNSFCNVPDTAETPMGSQHTHWMPIPPLLQKMVTIEISEEDAREWTTDGYFYGRDRLESRISRACRKALEGK